MAGMGRIVRSPCVAVVSYVAIPIYEFAGAAPILIISSLFTIAAFIAMLAGSSQYRSFLREADNPGRNRFERFCGKYQLTPRETDVLRLVTEKDVTGKEAAKELCISERVFQRYLTEIYTKTETKNKIGLIQLFYEDKEE